MSHDFSKAPELGHPYTTYYRCTKCGLVGYHIDTHILFISRHSQLPNSIASAFTSVDSITCDEYQIASVIL